MDSHLRKLRLKRFAATELEQTNRCLALVNIIARAAQQIDGEWFPANKLIEDLEKVLIGEDMQEGRGEGPYFVGHFRGAEGFRAELRDDWNQVQHATAGIVIGFRYGIAGHAVALYREDEPQDDALYNATCPLGWTLTHFNYRGLAERTRHAIGDVTCRAPAAAQ